MLARKNRHLRIRNVSWWYCAAESCYFWLIHIKRGGAGQCSQWTSTMSLSTTKTKHFLHNVKSRRDKVIDHLIMFCPNLHFILIKITATSCLSQTDFRLCFGRSVKETTHIHIWYWIFKTKTISRGSLTGVMYAGLRFESKPHSLN